MTAKYTSTTTPWIIPKICTPASDPLPMCLTAIPTSRPSHVIASAMAANRNHRASLGSSRFELPSGRVGTRHRIQTMPTAPAARMIVRRIQPLVARNALSEHTTAIDEIAAVFAERGMPSPDR